MKNNVFMTGIILFSLSTQVFAEWSGYIDIRRVEIHESGVFLVAPIVGLTESGCSAGQTYNYAQFSPSNEKLADRALSSAYYAQSTNKKIRVSISHCSSSYAVATGIWIE